MSLLDKLKGTSKQSAQQFLNMSGIEDSTLLTASKSRAAFLVISPVNLSTLSASTVMARIRDFTRVIEALGTVSFMAINSTQSYERNKHFLQRMAETERNPTLKELDNLDIRNYDEIRITMATSRQFLVVLSFPASEPLEAVHSVIAKAAQLMRDNNMNVRQATREDIKRLLAIYLEQNLFDDEPQDFDGADYLKALEMKV